LGVFGVFLEKASKYNGFHVGGRSVFFDLAGLENRLRAGIEIGVFQIVQDFGAITLK
jgi:hypothetical protein